MDGISKGAAVRVGVQDVGARVVVRYRLDGDALGPAGEHLTDVVGRLVEWGARAAAVERANGELVAVAFERMVAAKVLPPVAERRRRGPDESAEVPQAGPGV